MTEEIKPGEGVKTADTEQEVVIQSDPTTEAATAQGWVPKEEFQGDPHKWVDAGEFLRRGELFSKIDSQSREIKDVRKALLNLQEHYTKVKETEYNRALTALKREFKTANREGDYDRADALESEIESVEKEATKFKNEVVAVPDEPAQAHPEFVAWTSRNPWYNTQAHMRVFADSEGLKLRQAGLEPREVLKKVEEAVRKEFPTKFTNPNRERLAAVEGQSNRENGAKSEYKLTEIEARVMNSFLNQKDKSGKPLMTREAYIADLRRIKGEK